MNTNIYKSGETCPKTAKYIEVDCCGNISEIDGNRKIVNVDIDEQFPPTRKQNLVWKEL